MSRARFRVHGPYRHRNQWRLDVFDNGQRSKLTYPTYSEALLAVADMLAGRGNHRGNSLDAVASDIG